jgi:hypothetical protein
MKHKAPCSSRGYSGLRESGPLKIDEGRWWRCWWRWQSCWSRSPSHDDCPGDVPAPPGERGREPPASSYSLASPLDRRRVSPLVLGRHGSRRAGAPPRLDLSLCFSSVSRPRFWPFTVSFIRRSATPVGLKSWGDFYLEIIFLAAKEGHQPTYEVPTSHLGATTPWPRPGASWPPRAPSCVDSFSQKSHIFQNKSP